MMATRPKEFICKCYYSRNVFLKKYKLHVAYNNEDQFFQDYRQDLRMKGCVTDGQYKDVLKQIGEEISRREDFHQNSYRRYQTISETYKKLHPHIWDFKEHFLDDRLIQMVNSIRQMNNKDDAEDVIIQNGGSMIGPYIYRLPIFSIDFCNLLVEELAHFENSSCPKGRPSTMSLCGVSWDELGISETLLTPLIAKYIQPLSTALFQKWCNGRLDSFRAHSNHYGPGKDRDLSMHYDNAEITLNVNLTSQFEGGDLVFGGLWDEPDTHLDKETVTHQLGAGLLHLGQHTHQALPTESGLRSNLIIWMRSSAVRNEFCRMCGSKPDLVEVCFAGDGFTDTHNHKESGLCSTS